MPVVGKEDTKAGAAAFFFAIFFASGRCYYYFINTYKKIYKQERAWRWYYHVYHIINTSATLEDFSSFDA